MRGRSGGRGWGVLLRAARRDALRHRGRSALVLVMVALPVTGVSAALVLGVAALLALPALRVSGPYLAMVTVAFGFVVEAAATEWRGLTGGAAGLSGIPGAGIPGAGGIGGTAALACVACALGVAGR